MLRAGTFVELGLSQTPNPTRQLSEGFVTGFIKQSPLKMTTGSVR